MINVLLAGVLNVRYSVLDFIILIPALLLVVYFSDTCSRSIGVDVVVAGVAVAASGVSVASGIILLLSSGGPVGDRI